MDLWDQEDLGSLFRDILLHPLPTAGPPPPDDPGHGRDRRTEHRNRSTTGSRRVLWAVV